MTITSVTLGWFYSMLSLERYLRKNIEEQNAEIFRTAMPCHATFIPTVLRADFLLQQKQISHATPPNARTCKTLP
jgi:hypothetical protein